MKVLVIAFGNPDNVLSLCKNISGRIDLTLLFVLSGNIVKQGVFNLNLEGIENGFHTGENKIKQIFGDRISDYAGSNFRLWLLKTGSRKFIHRRTGPENFSVIESACRKLNREEFDVVHYNGTSGFMLYFLLMLKNKNRFWTLHDYKPHTGEENRSGDLLNKLVSGYKFNYIQHYEFLRNEFVKHYGTDSGKVHCVYSGPFDIYSSYVSNDMPVEKKYILFFGRISAYKGLNTLSAAFRKLPAGYKIKLVIAGSGKVDDSLFNHPDIICLNEYIVPEKLVALIKNSEFIVAPYTDATHSGVIMTAYNFRKPVVATYLRGIDEVLIDGKTGFLFRKNEEDDLILKMEHLLKNENLLNELSDNIDDLVENGSLSWGKISDRMVELYSGSIN